MGVSSSPAQLAHKLERAAIEMKDPTRAMVATAMQAKRTFEIAGAGVVGHKVAGKRKAIGVRFNMGRRGTAGAWALVMYTGPAHLVNNPTRAHEILPRHRPGVRTRRRGARALVINGAVRARANHRGTRGKHFFEKAKAIVEHQAPNTFAKEGLTQPLHKVFG